MASSQYKVSGLTVNLHVGPLGVFSELCNTETNPEVQNFSWRMCQPSNFYRTKSVPFLVQYPLS